MTKTLQAQERSIAWLARKAGVSVPYAWRMLNGERPLTESFKAKASAALGVPADVLFEEVAA